MGFFNNNKNNNENKIKPLSESEQKVLDVSEKIINCLGEATTRLVDSEENEYEVIRCTFEEGLLFIDKNKCVNEWTPRSSKWKYILIKFNENIVFHYSYSEGIKKFIDGKWIDLLLVYEKKVDMVKAEKERIAREQNQRDATWKSLAPFFNYIAECYVEKRAVYNRIKSMFDNEEITLNEETVGDVVFINGSYKNETVFTINSISKTGTICKYNYSCLNEIESIVKIAKNNEGRIIKNEIDSAAEQEIQRLMNTLKPDYK